MSKVSIIFGSVAVFLVLAVKVNSLPEETATGDSSQDVENNSNHQKDEISQTSTDGNEEENVKLRGLLDTITDALGVSGSEGIRGLGQKFMDFLQSIE